MISNLDNYKNKIDNIIKTLGVEQIKFYSGESILSIRDIFENNINKLIPDIRNDLDDTESYNLFIYIIQKALTLPVPYTTSNLKLMHYSANSIRNIACIYYQNTNNEDISFTVSHKQKMFDNLHAYIRQATPEEAMFVYRNSVLNLNNNSLILSELNMGSCEECKEYKSEYIYIRAYTNSLSFAVTKIPIKGGLIQNG